MAVSMVDVGMLLEDMLRSVTPRVDTLGSVLAVHVITRLRGRGAPLLALQVALVIGMAAAIGEVVTGEAVTGIRHMDIPGLAITAWAMAIRTTDIIPGDTTLTATDTGRT